MRLPAMLLPHTITVRILEGSGPYGDVYADPVTWDRANVEDKRKLVRDKTGAETVSETTVLLDPERIVPAGSLVTVWAGTPREREAKVITSGLIEHPAAPSHSILHLT